MPLGSSQASTPRGAGLQGASPSPGVSPPAQPRRSSGRLAGSALSLVRPSTCSGLNRWAKALRQVPEYGPLGAPFAGPKPEHSLASPRRDLRVGFPRYFPVGQHPNFSPERPLLRRDQERVVCPYKVFPPPLAPSFTPLVGPLSPRGEMGAQRCQEPGVCQGLAGPAGWRRFIGHLSRFPGSGDGGGWRGGGLGARSRTLSAVFKEDVCGLAWDIPIFSTPCLLPPSFFFRFSFP